MGTEGVNNLSALKSLMSLQKIPYDFGFYKMDFEVDHPTISLSFRGSVVPAGATVPVVASAGGTTAAGSDAVTGETALSKLRVYVEATRRMDLTLDEASSALAEEDFVKIRQQGQALSVSFPREFWIREWRGTIAFFVLLRGISFRVATTFYKKNEIC